MSYQIINFQKKLQNNNDVGTFLDTALGANKKTGMANMMVAINNQEKLALCDPMSVAAAIIQPTMLGLSLHTGDAYIIPYGKNATMQIGYKGLVTLALRTKEFVTLNADDVKEGEYKGVDRLTGEHKFNFIDDPAERMTKKTIGYFAFFELTNGFKKTLFWTQEQLHEHFVKFSKFNYDSIKREWKGGLLDIHHKSKITMLKQILMKWAPKSSEIVQAVQKDGSTYDEKGAEIKLDSNGEPKAKIDIADKEDIKSVLQQVSKAIVEQKLAKTQKETSTLMIQYIKSPEVNVDLNETGGWYGMSKDQLKLFAGYAENQLEIEVVVNGSRISQEPAEAEKEKEVSI